MSFLPTPIHPILARLAKEGITFFYHFTSVENLPLLCGRNALSHSLDHFSRRSYVAKLIFIEFDSGQSYTFHSRVQNNEKVSESLAEDIVSALQL